MTGLALGPVSLGHYLTVGAILFALSVIGIFLNRPTGLDEASTKAVGDAAHKYGTLTKEPDVSGLFGKA